MPDSTHDPIEVRKKLGELIRRLRVERGWSQEELANATGFGRSMTSSIERGRQDVRISTLVKLANIFGIHMGQLFRGDRNAARKMKPPVEL